QSSIQPVARSSEHKDVDRRHLSTRPRVPCVVRTPRLCSWVTITRACFAKPFSLGDRERRQRSFHDRNRRPATIHGTGTPSGTSKGHPITNAQTRTNPRTTAGKTTSKVTFADLGVPKKLTETLSREGKTAAFPIQQDTLPDTLVGRDVLGRGKTGSGKTLAFSIPLVARLAASPTGQAGVRRPR